MVTSSFILLQCDNDLIVHRSNRRGNVSELEVWSHPVAIGGRSDSNTSSNQRECFRDSLSVEFILQLSRSRWFDNKLRTRNSTSCDSRCSRICRKKRFTPHASLFTSQTPIIIPAPPTIAPVVIVSPRIGQANPAVTIGSMYRKTPACAAVTDRSPAYQKA